MVNKQVSERGRKKERAMERLESVVSPVCTVLCVCVCGWLCVQVSVRGVPGEVLCGEVSRMTVEVVNCGHVPLNSLRLTSSAGGQLLLDTVSDIMLYTVTVYSTLPPSVCNSMSLC